MIHSRRRVLTLGCLVALAALGATRIAAQPQSLSTLREPQGRPEPSRGATGSGQAGLRVEISFSQAVRSEPVTGMVYLAISRNTQSTPIQQVDPEGVPLFSTFVQDLKPGAPAIITRENRGHPVASLAEIPAGEYWVQPFVNVYTRFPRADGHTVWLHMDQWEGQNWKRSPGNLFGDPVKMRIDPSSATPIKLVADKVIPPIKVTADTDM